MRLLFCFMAFASCACAAYPIEKLKAPAHFEISLYAEVPGARSMALASDGTLFVGTGAFANPYERVYRIRDWNNDGTIEKAEIEIFIDNLTSPNGVALRNGSLYVAEVKQILVFDDVLKLPKGKTLKLSDARVLKQKFPDQGQHFWKFIRFAPPPHDNWLYVPVGADCNICLPASEEFEAIHRIDVTSEKREIVARGMRNSVGFDFHPVTGRLWFTDNGRDSLGDNTPPDELNEVTTPGQHFGYPYCHGHGIKDPDIGFDKNVKSCTDTVAPAVDLAAHTAALGMRFYGGKMFPAEYRQQIFIAEHGSWNRTKKQGYRVTTVVDKSGTLTYQPFISGWLDEATQKAWGRPVDVQEMPDGSLLISDDGVRGTATTGAIYRVTYR